MTEWEDNLNPDDLVADDESVPNPNLEEMLSKFKTDISEAYGKDKEFLEPFVEAIKEKRVPVLTFNGDESP
jgi:hypothetical protein